MLLHTICCRRQWTMIDDRPMVKQMLHHILSPHSLLPCTALSDTPICYGTGAVFGRPTSASFSYCRYESYSNDCPSCGHRIFTLPVDIYCLLFSSPPCWMSFQIISPIHTHTHSWALQRTIFSRSSPDSFSSCLCYWQLAPQLPLSDHRCYWLEMST